MRPNLEGHNLDVDLIKISGIPLRLLDTYAAKTHERLAAELFND